MQPRELRVVEAAGDPQRVEHALPQRLVDVDVPEARDRSLVEQRRLERGAPSVQPPSEPGRRERAERLRPEPGGEIGGQLALLEQLPGAEAPDIAIGDVRAIV